jgi:hypothetical protein
MKPVEKPIQPAVTNANNIQKSTPIQKNIPVEEEKNFDTKCKYEFPSLPKPVIEKKETVNAKTNNNQPKNKARNKYFLLFFNKKMILFIFFV